MSDVLVVFVATLVAMGLLLFAMLELLWPRVGASAPPPARIASPAGPADRSSPTSIAERPIPNPAAIIESRDAKAPVRAPRPPVPPNATPDSSAAPRPSSAGGDVEPPAPTPTLVVDALEPIAPADRVPAPRERVPSAERVGPRETAAPGREPESAARIADGATAEPPLPEPTPLDRCLALFERGRFADVVTRALEALEARAEAVPSAHEQAALWSLVGRARERLGDHESARDALERAIDVAPENERDGFRMQLASLGLSVASDILTRCRGLPDERRLAMLRDAHTWLERAQRERPADEGIAAAREAVNTGYWAAHESVVRGLVRRQEYAEARRQIAAAMRDPQIPDATTTLFAELQGEAVSAEIGQLTAAAIRESQHGREWEALAALEQAETLFTESGEVLPAERRDEVRRRLWLAYTKAGMRRAEAGEHEHAIKPLLSAVRYAGGDEARRGEPEAALLEALRHVIDDRCAVIREVAEMGNRESARVQAERLVELLEGARDAGVTPDKLAGVDATVTELTARLAG